MLKNKNTCILLCRLDTSALNSPSRQGSHSPPPKGPFGQTTLGVRIDVYMYHVLPRELSRG